MDNLTVNFTSNVTYLSRLLAVAMAFLVSLLTLYNAARLRQGILAVSTYAFGAGMLSLSLGFLALAAPAWADSDTISLTYHLLFILGFALLGFGSFKIYRMSRIK
ncbi:MAG: hypothetical protein M1142_06560 [Patescibacteria group bacterium]|nr:hypothetical protein [Patescibacteria group bacterium]